MVFSLSPLCRWAILIEGLLLFKAWSRSHSNIPSADTPELSKAFSSSLLNLKPWSYRWFFLYAPSAGNPYLSKVRLGYIFRAPSPSPPPFFVVFDQCCWLLYCCWLPSRALLSSLLLSCCTQCYCEALQAQTRWGALEVLFIIMLLLLPPCRMQVPVWSARLI